MARFETQIREAAHNLSAGAASADQWIDAMYGAQSLQQITLEMDSSFTRALRPLAVRV